jgi:diadenosine tetraphosphatase ApaH/serine/threonine PP2A family protein phosphatase
VSGNEDRVLLEQEPKSKTAGFTQAQLGAHHLAWLASLPRTMAFGTALLCHGTPTDDTTYLPSRVRRGALSVRRGEEIDALLGRVEQRLVFCGHDHTPRVVRRGVRLIVNPGSVGCPAYADDVPEEHVVENGSPDTRFAMVWPGADAATSVELIAVPYDAEAAAADALANGFHDWACWIATGHPEGRAENGGAA